MIQINKAEEILEASFDNTNRLDRRISDQVRIKILEKIQKKQTPKVIINLNGIKFIDSTGFKSLIEINNASKETECCLEIINANQEVEELFDLMNLKDSFNFSN